jgi:hypothetical protein
MMGLIIYEMCNICKYNFFVYLSKYALYLLTLHEVEEKNK